MARDIIWSERAQNDRKAIFLYWNERNQSNIYSKKLNTLFTKAIDLVAVYPEIGRPTDDKNARIKIVRDYFIIYELSTNQNIVILTIWDNRQNPERLRKIIQKK